MMAHSPLAADLAFGAYALAGRLAAPLVHGYLKRRLARGKEDAVRFGERLGVAGTARPAGPLLWIHGASVGEAQSALPLVVRLRHDWPAYSILVTTGTVTSARLMAERLPPGVIHQYVPADLPDAVARFLAHWRPDAGLIIESEFWPNLLRGAAARGTRLVLVNGRVSAGSYRNWRRMRPLIAGLLGCFELVLARSPEDHERLAALGARRVESPGDLKAAAPPLGADPEEMASLEQALAGRPRWLAASIHRGEGRAAARPVDPAGAAPSRARRRDPPHPGRPRPQRRPAQPRRADPA